MNNERKVTTRPMSEIEQRMYEDLAWSRTAPEVQQHAGMLVAIYNKQVLAVGLDQDILLAEAAGRAGCPKEHIVVTVVAPATLDEIPH